jgi:hypothetical protein
MFGSKSRTGPTPKVCDIQSGAILGFGGLDRNHQMKMVARHSTSKTEQAKISESSPIRRSTQGFRCTNDCCKQLSNPQSHERRTQLETQ